MDISAYQHMNIRMSTRGKRPLRNLTPNDKVRAIQRIHNGETKASVSRDIGVPESTLRGWCKNEQKLRFMCRQLGSSDSMGLTSPPEKRAKFDLQLMPPKFATMPNYDDLGFGNSPFHPMEYTSHSEAILEKLALVEFNKIKNHGFLPEAIKPMKDLRSNSTDSDLPVMGYSTNNMVQQLNLLALFNSKLSPIIDYTASNVLHNPKYSSEKLLPTLQDESEKNKYSCPQLSVKNWAKDPAKQLPSNQQTQLINDNNNNDCLITSSLNSEVTGQSLQIREELLTSNQNATFGTPNIEETTPAIDSDCNGSTLLDWCKMFSASLNFFAFAAAAASMHPTADLLPMTLEVKSKTNDLQDYNESGLKRLSPSVHSESSKESFYDSEPEDLSVRWSASKVSSLANSRSQSPDKNSRSSTSMHSDAEQ